jgi:diguanylate cyclase (GGDEF)-like protein
VLKHLHQSIGLDLWAVGRRQGDDWVVLSCEGGPIEGLRLPWEDTLCARVQNGQAEWATADVDLVPVLVEARELIGLPIRSFMTVPLHGAHGEVLGTLCGAGLQGPAEEGLQQYRREMDLMAELLGALLSAELRLEREARHREVAELDAQTDPLTGLGNRRRWDRQLAAEEERCLRYGSNAAVVTVDVDGLKVVNDRWGHDAGDALLRQLAGVLRRECRPGDVVARLGGDEFAILLAETANPQAEAVADRLRTALHAADVPASLGVAIRGRDGLTGAWRDADARMYAEKRRLSRREPVRPGTATTSASSGAKEALLEELLSLARTHLDADIAFLGRLEGGQRVIRAVQSVRPLPIGPGYSEDASSTYCQRLIDGVLPSAIPDTSQNPEAMAIEATRALPIGGYVGVPVNLPDGRLYGTLCCLTHEPAPQFDDAAVAFLTSVAGSLSRVLADEEVERAGRRSLLESIDGLLGAQALSMRYQPVVDLTDGAVRAAEALARFQDSSRTTAQWFTAAGHVDRSAELELRAVAMALDDTREWDRDVWLNLSASVLASPAVTGLFSGRDLSHLVVEVSEHEAVADYVALRRALFPWREAGLRVAVDDVGAGFASLRHVLELSPDIIKLDISLVQGMPNDPVRRALVTALVAFAQQAGATVVAEGIETEAELQSLRGTGVRLGQGFHLGVPMAPERLPQHVSLGMPTPRTTSGRPDGQDTLSRSTTKTSVSFGPMAPPAPRAP